MRRHWLIKSEPVKYPWQQLVQDGTTFWDGVRNFQARNLLRQAVVGERVLFYHSSAEPPAVAGIASIARAAEPDPSQFDKKSDHYDAAAKRDDPRWFGVTLRFEKKLPRPVPLPLLREQRALAKMVLLNRSRLSVQPVTDAEWKLIMELGGA